MSDTVPALTDDNADWCTDAAARKLLGVDQADLDQMVTDGLLTPLHWQGGSTRCFDRGEVNARLAMP